MLAAIAVVGVVLATIAVIVAIIRVGRATPDPWDDCGQSLRDLKAWQASRKAGGSILGCRSGGHGRFVGAGNHGGGSDVGSGDFGGGGSCGGAGVVVVEVAAAADDPVPHSISTQRVTQEASSSEANVTGTLYARASAHRACDTWSL